MPITSGLNHVATLTTNIERHADFYKRAFGEIQRLGSEWSPFFRDVDGMEPEVCAPADG